LPIVFGAAVVRFLQRLGFVVARQRGSHIVMRNGSQGCVVPNHRELKAGTLSGLLKQDIRQEICSKTCISRPGPMLAPKQGLSALHIISP